MLNPKKNALQADIWFRENIYPHEPMLKAWLSNRFSSGVDIDDVIQEAYVRILKAYHQNEVKAPKAYLFAVSRNLAMDIVRRSKIIQFNSLTETENSDVLDAGDSIPESIARNQELALLTKAIQTLPAQCRRIFTLRKVYCMSQIEIAEKLGISVNTVATQLKIGVKKCSAYMKEHVK